MSVAGGNDNTLFEPTWDEQYAAAPDRPQPPHLAPRNPGEVLAVAKALKSTGLSVPGPATAGAAAGVILSELRRLGYDVVPFNAEAVPVRISELMTGRTVVTTVANLSTGAPSAHALYLPATNNAARAPAYMLAIGRVA